MSPLRCADASAAAGESLAATAVTVESWLLVEVRATWPRDVAGFLADDTRGTAAIRSWLESVPASRLLLVRRPGVAAATQLVFVVNASETEAHVRRIELHEPAELDALDLERDGETVDASLVLVCGHGTRDACCALRGNAVFTALQPHVGRDELWVSSHQGGHRFAANVLVLPHGIQLGRVAPEDAVEVVDAARRGAISLEHFRGRTAYPPRIQAADIAVRAETGLRHVDDLIFVSDDGTTVTLESGDERRLEVMVDGVTGPSVPASCGAAPEPQPAFVARLA